MCPFFSSRSRSVAVLLFLASFAACAPATRAPTRPQASAGSSDAVSSDRDNEPSRNQTATQPAALDRDANPSRRPALIATELKALEALLEQTPTHEPDHATILDRMARDYVELGAREKAIATYARIVNEHPKYARLDEVLFSLAYEYEHGGDTANARRIYLELIEKAPTSRYVPNAYLAFGEMFFDEAGRDPSKLVLAAQAYEQTLQTPPPQNQVYGYACYKLAWVRRNQGDNESAAAAFKKAIAFSDAYASLPGSTKLGEAARADLAALGGEPDSIPAQDEK